MKRDRTNNKAWRVKTERKSFERKSCENQIFQHHLKVDSSFTFYHRIKMQITKISILPSSTKHFLFKCYANVEECKCLMLNCSETDFIAAMHYMPNRINTNSLLRKISMQNSQQYRCHQYEMSLVYACRYINNSRSRAIPYIGLSALFIYLCRCQPITCGCTISSIILAV